MTELKLYLQTQFSPNHIRKIPELVPYGDNYFMTDIALGVDVSTLFKKNSHFEGSFLAETNYNFVGGDDGNLGSHRHQLGGRVGWKQHLSRYLFLEPKVGLGGNLNWLNFGKGFPLEREAGLTFNVQALGGVQLPLAERTLLGIVAGYFYERSLAGASHYENQGAVVGLVLSTGVTKTPKPQPAPLQESEKVVERIVEKPALSPKAQKSAPPQCPPCPQYPQTPVPLHQSSSFEPDVIHDEKERRIFKIDPGIVLRDPYEFTHGNFENPLMKEKDPRGIFKELREPKLDAVIMYLLENPKLKIRIDGYANRVGRAAFDRVLSLQRAFWVQDYLIYRSAYLDQSPKGKGLEPTRIIVDGEFLDGFGQVMSVPFWQARKRGAKDARGASVYGDGRLWDGTEILLPYPDPADVRNRCVKFWKVQK